MDKQQRMVIGIVVAFLLLFLGLLALSTTATPESAQAFGQHLGYAIGQLLGTIIATSLVLLIPAFPLILLSAWIWRRRQARQHS